MNNIVITVEKLSKVYRLGQIGTGTLTNDLKVWWAKKRGLPNPLLKIGQSDHGNRDGEELWALRDVSFTVQQGEVLGIIGRNGAGKSTLLKILSRVTAPTGGCVKVCGRIASLLEVGTGFHPELTGRENIYLNGAILGMSKQEIARKFDEIVAFAEVEKFIDTPVKRYSSGMYVRLAFAVAAHLESEILLVDEVLAVGDAEFQKKCLGKMGDVASKEGRTVLFVSHNMGAVKNLCSSIIMLDHGHLISQHDPSKIISLYNGIFDKQSREYKSGPIRKVEVSQQGQELIISADYEINFDLYYPDFGFVISDYSGSQICWTSAKVDDIPVERKPRRSGSVQVTMSEPKLYNGTYRLGIWLGNGMAKFFLDYDCLNFDVLNMAILSHQGISELGPIHPNCNYQFLD